MCLLCGGVQSIEGNAGISVAGVPAGAALSPPQRSAGAPAVAAADLGGLQFEGLTQLSIVGETELRAGTPKAVSSQPRDPPAQHVPVAIDLSSGAAAAPDAATVVQASTIAAAIPVASLSSVDKLAVGSVAQAAVAGAVEPAADAVAAAVKAAPAPAALTSVSAEQLPAAAAASGEVVAVPPAAPPAVLPQTPASAVPHASSATAAVGAAAAAAAASAAARAASPKKTGRLKPISSQQTKSTELFRGVDADKDGVIEHHEITDVRSSASCFCHSRAVLASSILFVVYCSSCGPGWAATTLTARPSSTTACATSWRTCSMTQ